MVHPRDEKDLSRCGGKKDELEREAESERHSEGIPNGCVRQLDTVGKGAEGGGKKLVGSCYIILTSCT